MPLYRTRLIEMRSDSTPRPPYAARGWRADCRFFETVETATMRARDEVRAQKQVMDHHHQAAIVRTEALNRRRLRVVYAPEIILETTRRLAAQKAMNLITAARTSMDGDFTSGEPLTVVPDDPGELEDLDPDEYEFA